MINIIVACAHHNVIGKSNDLPWYLPADLRRFKEITTDHTVIMGRKTYQSILDRLGKPLPNRRNIVITRDKNFKANGATVVHSIEEALSEAGKDDTFIIGGAEIYNQSLHLADRIYLTEVYAEIEGDTYFPQIDPDTWREVARESHEPDEKNKHPFDWVILDRQ